MTDRRSSKIEDRKPRVALLPSDDGPCGFYRVLQPMMLLEKQGKIDLYLRRLENGYAFAPTWFDEADVVVVQRLQGAIPTPDQYSHALAFEDAVKAAGKRVVYEIDDDLARTSSGPTRSARVNATSRLVASCGWFTTTTHYAAKHLGGGHPAPRVIPNGLDVEMWRPPGYIPRSNRQTSRVRIVYAASRMHAADVQHLINPFRWIANRFPLVRFVLAGERYPELLRALGGRMEYAGQVSMKEWPAFARSLDGDIWVAPLQDSRFARSKSNLKWLEATAVGAAVVASPTEPYRVGPDGEPWKERPMFHARTGVEWTLALEHLVEHPEKRRALVERSIAVVHKHYTAQHTADAWMKVIQEVTDAGRF